MDKDHYLYSGLTPVDCSRCGVQVLVKKNSVPHTSVQWTVQAAQLCEELGQSPRQCVALRESIDLAVKRGLLEVGG